MTSSPFRIQYASDLHLELYETLPSFESLLSPVAPFLALAGDVGHPKQLSALLQWAAPQWERIFYVAGNHEYYCNGGTTTTKQTMAERQEAIREIVGHFGNVRYLEADAPDTMSYYDAPTNTAIIGCTLWSLTGAGAYRHCNDYRRIPNITPASLNAVHRAEATALRAAIATWTARGADICVITHHMPSFRLIHPAYAGMDGNDCFASRQDDLFGGPVKLWIYGHTHVTGITVLGGTQCCVNSRGYADEKPVGAPYRRDAVADVGDVGKVVAAVSDDEEVEMY